MRFESPRISPFQGSDLLIPGFGISDAWKFDEPQSPGEGTRPTTIAGSVGPVPLLGGSPSFHGIRKSEAKFAAKDFCGDKARARNISDPSRHVGLLGNRIRRQRAEVENPGRNPRWGWIFFTPQTQGSARMAQPWAWSRNPVGIRERGRSIIEG